jgi:anti-sigma B factor antagonist
MPNGALPLQQDHPEFRVDVHPQRDRVRVVPVGELDVATGPRLEAQLRQLRASGFEHIVLDLGELTFMDSTGIRLILAEEDFARSNARDFSLIGGGRPAVRRVIDVCGLDGHLRPSATLAPRLHTAGEVIRPAAAAQRR